jgi:drug/metabolite transporter (DMT)-like permease
MTLTEFRMFLACVAIWGTTWLAITYQLDGVAPEISVALRFGLAALLLAGYCFWRGYKLHFPWRVHRRFAAMGGSMFTAGYLFVYYAEQHVVSGLVAVGYCASPLINQYAYHLALGRPMSRRVSVVGLIGIGGIAIIFLPELSTLSASRDVAIGAMLTAGAVISSAVGNVFSSHLEADRVNVWQKMMFSMAWGAAGCLLVGLLRGVPLTLRFDSAFLLSLLYLALLGSIVAFAFYLTLLERIGGGRAGYVGVMVPVVALALSALFEGFAWQPLTFVGIAAAVAGNVVILLPARKLAGSAG